MAKGIASYANYWAFTRLGKSRLSLRKAPAAAMGAERGEAKLRRFVLKATCWIEGSLSAADPHYNPPP